MHRTLIVTAREYKAAVKSKAFVISLVLMPVMVGGSVLLQAVMKDHVDITDRKVAILDRSGVLYDAIAEKAAERNQTQITDPATGKQVRPRFLLEPVAPSGADPLDERLAQSERVRRQEIFAFVDIGPDVIAGGAGGEHARVRYYSNTPGFDDIHRWLRPTVHEIVQGRRLAENQLDPDLVKRITAPVPLETLGLVTVSAETGQVKEAERTNEIATFLVPFFLMMLMFMVVMVGATPLMQSVLEEKMQRIAEVLLGSVSPFELMMGKLLGVVGVSFTIVSVYLAGGLYALHRAGYLDLIPLSVLGWFVVYQGMAVLMFGSVFVAIGAAVTDMKEAQSMVTPAMLLLVMPMFVWMIVIKEPTSALSTGLSLFPPATPMLMVMRAAAAPQLPLWQPLLGVLLVLITTVLFVIAAGRIFRVGLLMQGKGARIGEMMKWAFTG